MAVAACGINARLSDRKGKNGGKMSLIRLRWTMITKLQY